ncbi:MAG: LEA type 2 family protein [Gemmatimonadales bacterium]
MALIPLLGCTPLGFWVYGDPVVSVSRVTLRLERLRYRGESPVVVALAVENPNDYALSSERVELSLRLDGVPIGKLRRDSTVPVEMAAVSTLALAVPLEKQATPEHLAALGSGTHSFAVRGRATFRTPFGMRKVRFEQEGAMKFGGRITDSVP